MATLFAYHKNKSKSRHMAANQQLCMHCLHVQNMKAGVGGDHAPLFLRITGKKKTNNLKNTKQQYKKQIQNDVKGEIWDEKQ